jgi:hypothetical protein
MRLKDIFSGCPSRNYKTGNPERERERVVDQNRESPVRMEAVQIRIE